MGKEERTRSMHAAPQTEAQRTARQRTARRRGRRRLRSLLLSFLLCLVLGPLVLGTVLVQDPAALEAVSAVVLPPQPHAQPWNGRDRLILALFGLTQRTTEPARTDTILILTLDPVQRRASLLSIPRDLWVDIPGYGPGKLAIAYAMGGPRLAVSTLQRDLGLPVEYYMAFTFRGFMRLIDALGGVTVDVPRELADPTYPCLTTTAYCPIAIKAGVQRLDGAHALEFVRERHAFAQQDLTRVRDQQAFLSAVRQQALAPGTVLRLPALLQVLRQDLRTDLPLNTLPSLALAYARVAAAQLTHAYIDLAGGLVQNAWSADGQAILLPTSPAGIPDLVRQLTHDPQWTRPGAAVTVWDGTGTPGLAAAVGATLHRAGLAVSAVGSTPHHGRTQTVVVRNTLVPAAPEDVAHVLRCLLHASIVTRPEYGAPTPLVVLLGADTGAAW